MAGSMVIWSTVGLAAALAKSPTDTCGALIESGRPPADAAMCYFERGAFAQAHPLFVAAAAAHSESDAAHGQYVGLSGFSCLQAAFRASNKPAMEPCIETMDQGLGILEGVGATNELADLLNLRATAHWFFDEFDLAESLFKLGLQYKREAGSLAGANAIWSNLALTYRWQGRPYLALGALRTALQLPGSRVEKAQELGSLAQVYQSLGEYHVAQTLVIQALGIHVDEGRTLSAAIAGRSLGSIYRELGFPGRAIALHLVSAVGLSAFGDQRRASALIEISIDLRRLGARRLSRIAGLQALNLVDNQFLEDDRLDALTTVVASSTPDGWHATRLRRMVDQLEPSDPRRLEYHIARLEALFRADDHHREVLASRDALDFLAELRRNTDPRLTAAWSNLAARVLASVIRSRLQVHEQSIPTDASDLFLLLEQHQHASLLSARAQPFGVQAPGPPGFENAWLALVRSEKEIALFGASTERLNRRSLAREKLLDASTVQSRSVGDEVNYADLESVQAQLAPGERMLRFFMHDGIAVVLAISRNEADARMIDLAAVNRVAASFLWRLERADSNYVEDARRLYETLVPAGFLAGAERLLIMPDGVLNAVPFASLNAAEEGYRPLAADLNVVRIASATSFYGETRPRGSDRSLDIAVFADPMFKSVKSSETDETEAMRAWRNELQRLPYTAAEASAIVQRFPGKAIRVATGSDATTETLLSDEFATARILHVATHGYFDSRVPGVMGFATTPTESDPGFLTLSEMVSGRYAGQLVVLSACETAMGAAYGGEGFVGPTSQLLSQGVDVVISSTWPIPDQATALFMAEFYDQLADTEDIVEALGMAQRKMMSQARYHHPRYWAGHVITAAFAPSLRISLN